jgi:hypothetical protein
MHQGAGAGFPKLQPTAPLAASAVWGTIKNHEVLLLLFS